MHGEAEGLGFDPGARQRVDERLRSGAQCVPVREGAAVIGGRALALTRHPVLGAVRTRQQERGVVGVLCYHPQVVQGPS